MTRTRQVLVRGPHGAELSGPTLAHALLVGLVPANVTRPLGQRPGSPMKARYLSDAIPAPGTGPSEGTE